MATMVVHQDHMQLALPLDPKTRKQLCEEVGALQRVLVPGAHQQPRWETLVGEAKCFTRFHRAAADVFYALSTQARTSFEEQRSSTFSLWRMTANCYQSCLTIL
jgi:hypothetical protein